MVNTYLNRKITAVFLAIFILSNSANISNAAMSVFDSTAYAKLVDQLNKLTSMVDGINEVSKATNDTLKTIGSFGKITLPFTSLENIGKQLRQDAQCLAPNLKNLMPNIDFKNISFSICETKNIYKETLYQNPKDINKLPIDQQNKAIKELKKYRSNILTDSALNGLSQADIAQENAKQHVIAGEDLEALGDAAMDERTQAATTIKGLALIVKGQAQTNQLLASLLRVNSATAIIIGGETFSDMVKEKNKGDDK